MEQPKKLEPATGKLLVLLPGMGAVATTFMAGTLLARRGLGKPIGSLTQMGTIRLGKRTENRTPRIRDFVPLAELDQLELAAWDISAANAYEAAVAASVLSREHLEQVRGDLEAIRPMTAAFDPAYVRCLNGEHVKKAATKMDLVEELRHDIRTALASKQAERAVCVWCGSTETYLAPGEVHQSVAAFERGLRENHPDISSSMLYAWACLKEGVPFANGAPNLTADIPAAQSLALELGVPIGGKDFKTGQTLMKTIIAPGLKARMLGLAGWFSTNILGNRDGEVLEDPQSFKTKELSKKGVLDGILQPKQFPDLYGDIYHKVRINYYPPRGDAKEGWDNIDLFGWLGYPMQLKVDFLCRDSILAAPIVLDLALFLDLSRRAGLRGVQEWLSFYFKSPMTHPNLYPEHDLFIQAMKLKNTLRWMRGEDAITHLGHEYYE